MCYDISFTTDVKELTDYFPDLVFDSEIHLEFGPIDHLQGVGVFPKMPVVYINKEDQLPHVRMMEWGVIEHYAKEEPDVKRRNYMCNIRSERVLDDQKSYWYKIRNRRCLFPTTAIYEHQKVKGQTKKVPYLVKPCDQKLFFIPGLRSEAEIVDKTTGEVVRRYTAALMTREANELMAWIHNDGDNSGRMPLFLPFELAREFLSDDLSTERYREILAYRMPSEDLYYHTTNTIRTSKPRPDGKHKNEEWDWGNIPKFVKESN